MESRWGGKILPFLTCVFLLLPGELMHGGTDLVLQDLNDVGQGGHAALIQTGEDFIFILL